MLATHGTLLESIRSMVGVPDRHWERLYQPLAESFAAWVQQLPASEAHHHAGSGGLLRHSLEVVHESLRLRRSALLPSGASVEELARLQDVWTYACVTAALLHDIGKPMSLTCG
jgi:23S rRNA maturation-related 3'-5' exoribonuclease YhaM